MARRLPRVLAICVGLVVLLGAAFWAGRVTLRPEALPAEVAPSALVVTVSEQSVGRSLNFNVTVSQPRRVVATNTLPGVVTGVKPAGVFVNGAVLYEVAGVPVRVVAGSFPFWRDLGVGDTGRDVAQLRAVLVSLGFLSQPGSSFDQSTVDAVKAWQAKLGTTETGAVKLGELVVVAKLPAALSVDDQVVSVGAVLAGGEKAVLAATGEPVFDLVLTPEQARLIPQSATVVIEHEGSSWTAVITGSENDQQGQTVIHLAGQDGGPVCGSDCASLATSESETYLMSKVQVVAPAKGPAVPVAAITTDVSGGASVQVVGAGGALERRPVRVLGSQDGVAVVDGVRVGGKVQVFGQGGGSQPSPPAQPSSASSSGR